LLKHKSENCNLARQAPNPQELVCALLGIPFRSGREDLAAGAGVKVTAITIRVLALRLM
jgi:hypothetical protein